MHSPTPSGGHRRPRHGISRREAAATPGAHAAGAGLAPRQPAWQPPALPPEPSARPERHRPVQPLASERVVVAAPMSFPGSAGRLARLPAPIASPYWKAAAWAVVAVLILAAWMVVLCWYLAFGLLLVPYRVVRRGQRNRKVERLRHREITSRLDRY